MQFDEDDLTTDSNTVTTKMIITNDGTCARHPHVQLRGKDSSGRNFQRDSCYECDREFEEQQKKLQERQKELDRRLKAIDDEEKDEDDDGRDRIKNMEKIKETEDEISAAPSNSTGVTANTYGGGYPPPPYGAYPMPPPHYGYPPYGYPHYPPPPPSSNSSTKGGAHPSPPPPPPHYAYPPPPGSVGSGGEESSKLFLLLNQKEEELKDLRSKYEESQAQVQRQSMEIARLESRLDQTNANMDQERKIARLEAEAAANERLEILLQGQRREHRETMKQMQDQMAQAAAAISLASHEAPPPPTLENHPAAATDSYDLPKSTDTTLSADSGSLKDDTDYKSYNTQDNLKLPPPAPAPAPIKWDKPRALPSDTESLDIDNDTMASSVLEYIEDNNVPKHTKQKQKARPWESSYVDHNGNGSVVDDVSVGVASAAGKQREKTPSESDSSNRTEQDDAFDVGDSDNKFVPKYSDPNEQQPILDDDTRSLGQTVASSTYGEDRQKVVNKTLLDPYGDKGCYTGVVLRTTGMPHGLGRMVYEEDGRVYEGDWYVAISLSNIFEKH